MPTERTLQRSWSPEAFEPEPGAQEVKTAARCPGPTPAPHLNALRQVVETMQAAKLNGEVQLTRDPVD